MYEKGYLKFGSVMDTRTDDYDTGDWFHLPHSCDAWVIGTKEQAQQLIEDLQEMINDPSRR